MNRVAVVMCLIIFSIYNLGNCKEIILKVKSPQNSSEVSIDLILDGEIILSKLGKDYGSYGRTDQTLNRCNNPLQENTIDISTSLNSAKNRFYNLKNLICDSNDRLNFDDSSLLASTVEKNIWGYVTRANSTIQISTNYSNRTSQLLEAPQIDQLGLFYSFAQNTFKIKSMIQIVDSFLSSTSPESHSNDFNQNSTFRMGDAVGPTGIREIESTYATLNQKISSTSADLSLNVTISKDVSPKRRGLNARHLSITDFHNYIGDSAVYASVTLNHLVIDQWNNPSLNRNIEMVSTLSGKLRCEKNDTYESGGDEVIFLCKIAREDDKLKIESKAYKNEFKSYSLVPENQGFLYEFIF